jgi:hypothetical protein
MTNDRKPRVSVTLTRKESDWLLNLLDRETQSNTEGDPDKLIVSRAQYGFRAAALADRIRAEG